MRNSLLGLMRENPAAAPRLRFTNHIPEACPRHFESPFQW
jgi:hypothetical protein